MPAANGATSTVRGPLRQLSTRAATRQRVLAIEDNPGDARLIREMLRGRGDELFVLEHVSSLTDGLRRLEAGGVDVILLDLNLSDSQGLSTLKRVQAIAPLVPTVVLTGHGDDIVGHQAVFQGAQDYLLKARINAEALTRVLTYSIDRATLIRAEEAALDRATAAQRRLAYLAETSGLLIKSLDLAATAQQAADAAVPALADLSVVLLVEEEDGLPHSVAVAHVDPVAAERLRALHRQAPLQFHASRVLQRSFATRRTIRLRTVRDAQLERIATVPEQLSALRELGVKQAIIVPLVARDHVLGALVLAVTQSQRQYATEDLMLAEVVARRAALALDNARLYRDLDRALHDRENFFAAASHDLRNPLAKIKLLAEMLRTLDAEDVPDSLDRITSRIEGLVDRSVGLVTELLDAARLEASKPLPLNRSETDLVELVRILVDEASAQAAQTFRFETRVRKLSGYWDAARLGRVVDNLLTNATKYSPADSEIVVRTDRADRHGQSWAALEVEDRGMGIPAADLPHIFERFHRAPNVESRAMGTGLGLWGARHIIEQHGGHISIISKERQGTTVTVYLPMEPAVLT